MKQAIRRVLLVSVSLFIFGMVGCKKSNPIDYNNLLIQNQTNVMEKMIALTDTFGNSEPAAMEAKLKELVLVIDQAIVNVSRVEAFDGDMALRDALLNLLKFYKEISDKEFQEIITILGRTNSPITQADIDRMNVINQDISAREIQFDKELEKAQHEFAKKYKFEVTTNKLQEKFDQMNQK